VPAIVVNNDTRNTTTAAATGTAPGGAAAGRPGDGLGVVRNLQVVADKDNNTLLIVATPLEYTVIEAALKKLDVPARQVMMDVTIAEVTLKDEIDFGIDWLFKGGAPSGRGSGGLVVGKGSVPTNPAVPGTSVTGGTTTNPVLAIAQGFTYIINNANFPGGVQAVLRLMDTYGNTKVVANPRLAALDNQKATIKSGDRIPINQQSNVNGVNNSVITTTSQYIDTGVLLQVTPHINQGGLVTLDVQAEVSNPGNANVGEAPPINTRSVQTIVSVQSGQTMVMGGLIGENKSTASAGLPWISRIPFVGGLFGQQALTNNRTELVMFITPYVLENELDLKGVMDDLRKKMDWMDDILPPPRPRPMGQAPQ
jgi:general secretion pathway protein D